MAVTKNNNTETRYLQVTIPEEVDTAFRVRAVKRGHKVAEAVTLALTEYAGEELPRLRDERAAIEEEERG